MYNWNYNDEALDSGYCLHTLIKKEDDSRYQILLLCTYFLETCLKALKTLYPEGTTEKEGYEYYSTPFEFERCGDPCLAITRSTSDDDLRIEIKHRNEIRASAVNFWRSGKDRLYRMKREHDMKIYPPSVTIIAYTNRPGSRNATITLDVKGMKEPTSQTITVVKKFTVGFSLLAPPDSTLNLEKHLDWDNESEKDLIKIAHHMLDWEEKLLPHLGFTHVDTCDIKDIHKDNPELQRRAVLRRWREKHGLGATYGKLLEVFMSSGNLQYAAIVLDVLNKRP